MERGAPAVFSGSLSFSKATWAPPWLAQPVRLQNLRMDLAQRYVIGGDKALTEVAAQLGFSAPSGFSRWYQAQFGCSPTQARTQARSKGITAA